VEWSKRLSSLPRLLLLRLSGLFGHVVQVDALGVLQAPQNEHRLGVVALDQGLLDVDVNRRLHSRHETGAHVDAVSAQGQARGQLDSSALG